MKSLGRKKGFTLVELSLSIAFIGVLSLSIVFIINNAIGTYRRGLTLNQINTAGMDLVDDIRASIRDSLPLVLDDGWSLDKMVVVQEDTVIFDGSEVEMPVSGAFCTGTYSYVWNSGYFFSGKVENNRNRIILNDLDDYKLAKIEDRNRSICEKIATNRAEADGSISISMTGKVVELLGAKDSSTGLAIYSLRSSMPATTANASLYSVSFILGTVQGGANINASGNFCKPPSDGSSEFNYCSINKFNFTAQAGGFNG